MPLRPCARDAFPATVAVRVLRRRLPGMRPAPSLLLALVVVALAARPDALADPTTTASACATLSCDDADPCTVDLCDDVLGTCTHTLDSLCLTEEARSSVAAILTELRAVRPSRIGGSTLKHRLVAYLETASRLLPGGPPFVQGPRSSDLRRALRRLQRFCWAMRRFRAAVVANAASGRTDPSLAADLVRPLPPRICAPLILRARHL